MKKKWKLFILLPLIWFISHSLFVIYDGFNDKKSNADIAVVLGNKINIDGTLSERLKARLDKSIQLYNDKRVPKILVSGGFGKEGFWEGNKMRDYLESKNIPKEKIIVDNYGDNTEKTVVNTIRISDSLNYKKIISVSQYYHQTRIKKLFKSRSFNNIESSSPNYFEIRDCYSIFREFIAYYLD